MVTEEKEFNLVMERGGLDPGDAKHDFVAIEKEIEKFEAKKAQRQKDLVIELMDKILEKCVTAYRLMITRWSLGAVMNPDRLNMIESRMRSNVITV
ncbi:hypothetical protein ACFL0V_07280, partial [Nanoarchaeota archaeon]